MTLHFTDIVHQAEEQPLRIYFLLAAQAEAIETMCVPDIAEHGLDGAKSAAILIAPLIGVDLALHLLKISFWHALGAA